MSSRLPMRVLCLVPWALVVGACSPEAERKSSIPAPLVSLSEEALAPQREKDQAVLRALEDARSDLSKPHSIEHHFICSTAMLAESVRTRGASLGFEPSRVVEQRDSGQTYFSVDLVRVAVPTAAEISAQTRTMLALAATCRVEYDGWGCMVVK
jgi:hypothetical protein